jgi:hypothetical protein
MRIRKGTRRGRAAALVALAACAAGAVVRRDGVAANGRALDAHLIHRDVIPSFSRQTGLACTQCHTTFPYLTPFGRRFKLNGYTLTGLRLIEAGDTGPRTLKLDLISPVSTMVVASLTQVKRSQPGSQNGNVEFPQQASLFLGEAISPNLGTFLQFTYDAAGGSFHVDNADIRYASKRTLGSRELFYGMSLNNNPTVQDVWNSTPAWRVPFMSSAVAPAPAAAPLLEGRLAQRVAGLGGYALWDNRVYGEFSVYRSAPQGGPHPPDSSAACTLRGVAPYWRVALQHGWRSQYLEVGTYGLSTTLYPSGVTGPTDRYTDVAWDAQYEWRVGGGNLTAHATWIHERQHLDATVLTGGAATVSSSLRTFRADAAFYDAGRVGATLAYFSTAGARDTLRYRPAPIAGSRTGRPNSSGLIGQLDFLPWLNTRFALQYVAYAGFNGSADDYDGFGRNASDNNALYLMGWLVF